MTCLRELICPRAQMLELFSVVSKENCEESFWAVFFFRVNCAIRKSQEII